jgi:RNA polymerase sigma factor (sigma-70 family)
MGWGMLQAQEFLSPPKLSHWSPELWHPRYWFSHQSKQSATRFPKPQADVLPFSLANPVESAINGARPMSIPSPEDDQVLVFRICREGCVEALAQLRAQTHRSLLNILLARKATATEAEDILADIWADCVPGVEAHPSLLEKFSGRTSLLSWLATVATNRWLDFKRKEMRRAALLAAKPEVNGAADEAVSQHVLEEPLVVLLSESLRAAFARCSAEHLVLLRLVYLHDVSQREIGRMLGWSESKTSRFLSEALEQIQSSSLREVKKRDPWLELSWQDFVELCETRRIGFL